VSTVADPYAPMADLYDLAYGDYIEDIDFYLNLARATGGPILELGAGTGRVAFPLAKAGHRVVGIDASPALLSKAQEKLKVSRLSRQRLSFLEADMTDFSLDERFALTFVAASTFQHLTTTAAQRACIRRAASHLQPGGTLAISVRSPASVSWDDTGPNPLLLDWTRRDESTGDTVMKFIASEANPAAMTRRLTYVYDRLHDGAVFRTVFETELRYSTQAEIEALLQDARLRVTHVYGDYDLSPVGAGTENLVFVARAERPS
jgi:SAM-dependent methyltransferase